ncbi:addiction module toxin, RelE/StbE family [Candidatus Ornithobacterium hominis]|nr:addiction module toxin, RelE/StbE family [Candidatus Ornithobacterium hominis]
MLLYLYHQNKAMYKVEFSKKAVKSIKKIAKNYQALILSKIDELAKNPFENNNVKAMKGTDKVYRLRVAEYRIVYEMKDAELIILIIEIDHRKNIYKK